MIMRLGLDVILARISLRSWKLIAATTHCTIFGDVPHKEGSELEKRKGNHARKLDLIQGGSLVVVIEFCLFADARATN